MNKGFKVFILILSILVLASCTLREDLKQEKNVTSNNNSSELITVTDFNNNKISVMKQPQKIVVLSPSVAQIIKALGFENKIIGASEECKIDKNNKGITLVGSYSNIDVDKILSLKPDVIFTSKYIYSSLNNSFVENGISSLFIEPASYSSIFDAVDILGKVLDKQEKSEQIKDELKNKVDKIAQDEKLERKNVSSMRIGSTKCAAASCRRSAT